MANFKLIWDNKTDSSTLSGGFWEALLPLTNVQDKLLQKTARSEDVALTSTQFNCDTDPASSIQAIVLCNHNMSLTSLIRIRLSDDVYFATSDYDSGWVDVFESVYSPENVNWEDDNFWFGKLDQRSLSGYSVNYTHLMTESYSNQYMRIEINDTGNSDGYVEFGRLITAPIFQFVKNAIYGATISWKDETIVSESIGGSAFHEQRQKRRNYSFSTDFMDVDEALESVFELQRNRGVSGEIFLIPDSDDVLNSFRTSFLGRFTKLEGITHRFFSKYKTSYNIEEIL